MTLSQYSTITETIQFEAMLYSDDPTNAILATCGGIDIARPDEPQDMQVLFESDETLR